MIVVMEVSGGIERMDDFGMMLAVGTFCDAGDMLEFGSFTGGEGIVENVSCNIVVIRDDVYAGNLNSESRFMPIFSSHY